MVNLVQQLLADHCCVSSGETCFQTCRWLQRHLDGHLQQANWEPQCNLACNPEAEILVDFRRFREHIFHLIHVTNTKMAVLKDDPATCKESCVVLLSRDLLLAFSHGYLVSWELFLLLRKFVNGHRGVTTCCQQIK